ncbi:MAG: NTP transferase domain-containing protein [Armatimonadetes bacterium]|nr:NTP transferase domain-containing protein [Armatimonadota bacterium]
MKVGQNFQAVILAAGAGKRLRPLSLTRSKALAPLCGKPMVQWVLESLLDAGIEDVVVVVAALDDDVACWFRDWPGPGHIELVVQPEKKGMANALACAAPKLHKRFIMHACDTIIEPSTVEMLLTSHLDRGAACTLSLEKVHTPEQIRRTGIVAFEGERITWIIEKPEPEEAPSDTSAIPVYLFDPQVLDYLPEVQPSKRGEYEIQDAIKLVITRDREVYGRMVPNRWQITTCDDLLALNCDWLARGFTRTHDQATCIGPVHIGDGVTFGPGCTIGPNAVIEAGAVLGAGVTVRHAILLRDASVPDGALVENTVLAAEPA